MRVAPFWRYFGGKSRLSGKYPEPQCSTIIEPFAGSAGYSLRYAERDVILVEKYPVVADVWRWLIQATPEEVLSVPLVDDVRELPEWAPQGARYLVGFCMNDANVSPCVTLSAGIKKFRSEGDTLSGWSERRRQRVADGVTRIKHWRIIEGDYSEAPDVEATWFVDPPYSSAAGRAYKHHDIDYAALGDWCQHRRGQMIVCEGEGATWLPFVPFAMTKGGPASRGTREQAEGVGRMSREVVWHRPKRYTWDDWMGAE